MVGLSDSMRAARVLLSVAIAGAVAWACELEDEPPTQVPLGEADRALKKAYCERLFDCSCRDPRPYETLDACEDDIAARMVMLRTEADAEGISYDPACLGVVVDTLDRVGCDPPHVRDDDDDNECVAPCNALFGTKAAGESCTRLEYGSSCAQGLVCDYECDETGECAERCVDPCNRACDCEDDEWCDSATEACVPRAAVGESCDTTPCVPDSICVFAPGATTAECVALPTEGEPCENGSCAEDLRCVADPSDGSTTCQRRGEQGDPCTGHNQCETGYCPAGFCDALPGKGDSCAGTRACAQGLECAAEGDVCVAADPAICEAWLYI
jgi:hypothetical protein